MEINLENLTYRQSTVALIIDKDTNILIVQKDSFKSDEWDFPGGGIDNNEKAEETILRELKEELGSEKFRILKRDRNIDKYNWTEDYILWRWKKYGKTYKGQERTRFLVEFLGSKDEIKIQEEEIRKYQWIKIKDLKKYLVFPGYFKRIKKVLKEWDLEERC